MKGIFNSLVILVATTVLAETGNDTSLLPKPKVSGEMAVSAQPAPSTNSSFHVMATTNESPRAASSTTAPGTTTDARNSPTESGAATTPKEAGAKTDSLDNLHDTILLKMQERVNRFDLFFAKDQTSVIEAPGSKFRMGLYVVGEYDNGMNISADPDFDADLELPNLESRWNIFANSIKFSDLPGVDPTEAKRVFNTGLGHVFEKTKLHASVGARWNGTPLAFTKLEWKPSFSAASWTFYPRQRVFYQTDDEGFGGITSLVANRWIGTRSFVRSVSAAKIAENTAGVEWEQTLMFGHVNRLIDESKKTDIISQEDAAQGYGARYSVFGHNKSDMGVLDRHRLTLVYRRPVLRKWLFLQVAPGAEWKNDNNWKCIPSLQIGFDAIFWEVTRK